MKGLIWILSALIVIILNTLLGLFAGFYIGGGALGGLILMGSVSVIARYFCRLWDEHLIKKKK